MHEWRQLYRGLELRTGHTNRCRKEFGKPRHQSNIEALYLRERTFNCIALRRRQAASCWVIRAGVR